MLSKWELSILDECVQYYEQNKYPVVKYGNKSDLLSFWLLRIKIVSLLWSLEMNKKCKIVSSLRQGAVVL